MIGIMNCGHDTSVEFYASNRQSSLYQRKTSKDSRTYTPEGRVLINGVPETQECPDEMWRSLICKAITTRVMEDAKNEEIQKDSSPLAVIRRFSSRLGIHGGRRSGKQNSENGDQNGEKSEAGENGENDEKSAEAEGNGKHVTIIRVKTVQRKDGGNQEEDNTDGNDEEEFRIYAHDSILKRLMEEKAMIEKEMGDVSMEWAKDETKVSVDENHDMIIERL